LKFLPDTSPTDDFQDMRRARMRESKAEVWDERQRKG
jgi:hypothetical protein